MITRHRHIAHLCLHAVLTGDQYADAIEPMPGVTPHVQAVPPNAVQLDLTSALRYFDLSPYNVVQLAKIRLKALYGIDSSAGLAGNRMPAAMAADASFRAFAIRADALLPADSAYRQLSMDPGDDRARVAEAAADRARRRFGPWVIRPATLAD
ncbi:hypothetical protein ACIA8P_47760 [Streptomyces cellulosae]|uniref:Uncharacterized protein n=1 Tax=Streptomyces cellulosae TaxID=1968 RepID=A0ABW7YIA3_STRCE